VGGARGVVRGWRAGWRRRERRLDRGADRPHGAHCRAELRRPIAAPSLVVAAIGVGKVAMPDVDGWLDGRELALGVAVNAIVALRYTVAVRWPRARVERAGTG